MFPGPYTTGVVVAAPPSGNTTWYNSQTIFPPLPTKTGIFNSTRASLEAARATHCPLNDDDILNGWTIYDLPDACAPLLDPYCNPDLNKPAPASTQFPAVCTPNRASTTAAPAPTDSIPSPLHPNTIASCQKYYQILGGDNCYSIANNFKITLAQVCCRISSIDTPLINFSSIHGIRIRGLVAPNCILGIMFVFSPDRFRRLSASREMAGQTYQYTILRDLDCGGF